jgi:hypothetical protein
LQEFIRAVIFGPLGEERDQTVVSHASRFVANSSGFDSAASFQKRAAVGIICFIFQLNSDVPGVVSVLNYDIGAVFFDGALEGHIFFAFECG